jgi:Fur family zinc uptake transcriptional regulator|tara:strand:- start:2598 stop:3056 length:459 start_codon:yes stop_codon:yes gene_type:complete
MTKIPRTQFPRLPNFPKLTKNQELVFDQLCQAGEPLSAYTLLDLLRDQGLRAPLQIYRALERLQAEGLVHRLESLNAFVACAHPHHHLGSVIFAICRDCGAAQEFTDAGVAGRLAERAQEKTFAIDSTTVELHGHCSACQAADEEEPPTGKR